MYNYKDIHTIHLEITSKCQASCPMCARNIQGGVDNPFMTLAEITLDQFKEWFPREFINQLDRLILCGNLGDPIIAKDTVEILEYCRSVNPHIHFSMNTNGSARDFNFWKSIAELGVVVRFGLDGLEDTHSIYRKGTNFNKIITNATTFIQHGGHAVWDMLVFAHNQHQIEQCRELSKQLGFKEFYSKNTSRFKDESIVVLDKIGKPVYKIYGTDRSKVIADAVVVQNLEEPKVTISCKVKKEGSLYVSANGVVSPCCWLDMEWMPPQSFSRIDYMEKITEIKNLQNDSLQQIFDSGYFKKIQDDWSCNPLRECKKQCGEVDRFNEQFK